MPLISFIFVFGNLHSLFLFYSSLWKIVKPTLYLNINVFCSNPNHWPFDMLFFLNENIIQWTFSTILSKCKFSRLFIPGQCKALSCDIEDRKMEPRKPICESWGAEEYCWTFKLHSLKKWISDIRSAQFLNFVLAGLMLRF